MGNVDKIWCSLKDVIDYLYKRHASGDTEATPLYYGMIEARDAFLERERQHGPFA